MGRVLDCLADNPSESVNEEHTMPTPTVPTPGTPPAPAAARRRTTRRRVPAATPGRPGDMEFQLQRLDTPLRLRQVARDPVWDRFKTIMVIIGGLLFFWVFGERMFLWGADNRPVSIPTAVWQPASAPAAPPQVTVNLPGHIQVDATV